MHKILFFGLTGLGNSILKGLINTNCEIIGLVTDKQYCGFKYYEEIPLDIFAQSNSIPVFYSLEHADLLSYDTIVVGSYSKKIPEKIILNAKLAINIHPSLLPDYRGANPYYWAIKNEEKETGVTIHRLTRNLDDGEYLLQGCYTIKSNETQGSLRKELSLLGERLILIYFQNTTYWNARPVIKSHNSIKYAPRVQDAERRILDIYEVGTQDSHRRALTPYPGYI